jgi:flagellar hook-associated protein 1 FlgK
MSTLRTAGLIAQSGLTAAQSSLTATAANVSNADTDGYTRKTTTQNATAVNSTGIGSSVNVTGISRDVDTFLTRQIVSATSASAKADTLSSYMTQIEAIYGGLSADGESASIASLIDDAAAALTTAAASGSDSTDRQAAVEELEAMASSLSTASAEVQDTRTQADQEIADTIEQANSAIQTIADLNDAIVKGKASGTATADLEDQRDEALKALSGMIDVSYSLDSDGRMQVYTGSGAALVTSYAHTLEFSTTSNISADTLYSEGELSGISVNGRDISDSISSGSLRALLDVRDSTLVDEQSRLDNLATTLIETLNTISNSGTSYPPADELTSSGTVSASDTLSGSGSFTLVATSDDTVASSLTIDLSSVSSVQDLIDTINASGSFTAEITTEGKLKLASTDSSQGIAIDQGDSAVGSDGEGLSAYLGLNDLLTGTGASNIAVNQTIVDNPELLQAATLASTVVGERAVSSGDTSVLSSLADAFTGKQTFSSAGGLSSRGTTFSSYAGDIVSAAARASTTASTKASTAESTLSDLVTAFSSQSGVNLDEETAATQSLETAYQAAAQVMSALQNMYDTLIDMVN